MSTTARLQLQVAAARAARAKPRREPRSGATSRTPRRGTQPTAGLTFPCLRVKESFCRQGQPCSAAPVGGVHVPLMEQSSQLDAPTASAPRAPRAGSPDPQGRPQALADCGVYRPYDGHQRLVTSPSAKSRHAVARGDRQRAARAVPRRQDARGERHRRRRRRRDHLYGDPVPDHRLGQSSGEARSVPSVSRRIRLPAGAGSPREPRRRDCGSAAT